MYAIWLIPSASAFGLYQNVIDGLSEKLGGPSFSPHITLISNITNYPSDKQMYHLSVLGAINPVFDLSFYKFEYQSDFYRCFYLVANEKLELNNLYHDAMSIFPDTLHRRFTPHLSLFYGDLSLEEKTQIAQDFDTDLFGKVQIKTLRLMKIEGSPEEWIPIEDFPFFKEETIKTPLLSPLFKYS